MTPSTYDMHMRSQQIRWSLRASAKNYTSQSDSTFGHVKLEASPRVFIDCEAGTGQHRTTRSRLTPIVTQDTLKPETTINHACPLLKMTLYND